MLDIVVTNVMHAGGILKMQEMYVIFIAKTRLGFLRPLEIATSNDSCLSGQMRETRSGACRCRKPRFGNTGRCTLGVAGGSKNVAATQSIDHYRISYPLHHAKAAACIMSLSSHSISTRANTLTLFSEVMEP